MWSKSPVDYFCMLMKALHRDTDRDTAILDEVTQAGWELVLPKVVWNALRHHAWSVEIDRASHHFFWMQALEVAPLGPGGGAATTLLSPEAPSAYWRSEWGKTHTTYEDSLDRRTLLLFNIRKLEIHTIHEFNYSFLGIVHTLSS